MDVVSEDPRRPRPLPIPAPRRNSDNAPAEDAENGDDEDATWRANPPTSPSWAAEPAERSENRTVRNPLLRKPQWNPKKQ